MRLGGGGGRDEPRAQFQVPALERAKSPFHESQILIPVMHRLRIRLCGWEIGRNDITASYLRRRLERRRGERQD